VARLGVPAARVVVRHEVDKVERVGEGLELQSVVVCGARGAGDGQEEFVVVCVRGRVGVEGRADLAQEQDKVCRLDRVGRVLPVDVDAVEAEVGEQPDGRRGEQGPRRRGRGGGGKVCRVGPPADREEDLELPVGPLEEVELLDAAVDVCAYVLPC